MSRAIMHIHILGICGTFMGGVAALARAAGHTVTGSDRNAYPPMSTQLEQLGISVLDEDYARQFEPRPDCVIVGNVMSRGRPVVEQLLESGIPYFSGPEWLSRYVLLDRWVLAVSGTHGKTTTSAMLAWILEFAGMNPGFLIGGIPSNFSVSAQFGKAPFFVVEADEYDTAFFDKRAKFVHYRPRTLVITNLEYDHADIYPNLAAIQWQFHQLLRCVPGNGLVISNADSRAIAETLEMGCWTPVESFASQADATWQVQLEASDQKLIVLRDGKVQGSGDWEPIGRHNAENALAALLAARHAGVPLEQGFAALANFKGVKRRMEIRGTESGVTVYDDFAHHPTAIRESISGLRSRVGDVRIVAILEPRSNTMKLGVHCDQLAGSLSGADSIWLYQPADLGWDISSVANELGADTDICTSIDTLVEKLAGDSRPGDHLLIMSNGDFGGIHERLLDALARKG